MNDTLFITTGISGGYYICRQHTDGQRTWTEQLAFRNTKSQAAALLRVMKEDDKTWKGNKAGW